MAAADLILTSILISNHHTAGGVFLSPRHGGRAQGGGRVSTRSRGAGRDQGGGGGGVPVPAQPLRPGRRVQGGQRQLRQPPAHLHLPVSVTCVIITRVSRVNIVTDAGTEVTPWCGAAAGSVSVTPSAPPTSPASTTGARTPARAPTPPAGTTPTARWISKSSISCII